MLLETGQGNLRVRVLEINSAETYKLRKMPLICNVGMDIPNKTESNLFAVIFIDQQLLQLV